MTKKEQFLEAVRKNFEEAEHRRQWLRTNLETYRTKALEASQNPEIGRDRTAELIAGMLAKQLANLEMFTLARCYMAYKELFKGEVRLHSKQFEPIVLEAKKRDYNGYWAESRYRFFGYEVRSSIGIGPSDGTNYHNRRLNPDSISESVNHLSQSVEADRRKTLGDIIQEAETITTAWSMMVEAKNNYENNLAKLRTMLGTIRYDNEFKYKFSVSAY